MARPRELTKMKMPTGVRPRWRKVYRGKTYYFRGNYQDALAQWQRQKAEIDALPPETQHPMVLAETTTYSHSGSGDMDARTWPRSPRSTLRGCRNNWRRDTRSSRCPSGKKTLCGSIGMIPIWICCGKTDSSKCTRMNNTATRSLWRIQFKHTSRASFGTEKRTTSKEESRLARSKSCGIA